MKGVPIREAHVALPPAGGDAIRARAFKKLESQVRELQLMAEATALLSSLILFDSPISELRRMVETSSLRSVDFLVDKVDDMARALELEFAAAEDEAVELEITEVARGLASKPLISKTPSFRSGTWPSPSR